MNITIGRGLYLSDDIKLRLQWEGVYAARVSTVDWLYKYKYTIEQWRATLLFLYMYSLIMDDDEENWFKLICLEIDEIESPISSTKLFQLDILDDPSLMLSSGVDKDGLNGARVFDILKRFRRKCNTEVIDCLIHGVIWLLNRGLIDERMRVYSEVKQPVSAEALAFLTENRANNRYNQADAGVSLILATKANWWTQGHHVGEKGMSNLLKQHIKELFKDRARLYIYNLPLLEALWITGHWLNSNWTLTNFMNKVHSYHFPTISTLTLNAFDRFPSGAGKYSLYFQILESIFQSQYNGALETIDNKVLTKFLTIYFSIKHNQMAYHRRANRVGWSSPIQIPQPDESIQDICSAYIHIALPNSKLSKASGIKSEKHLYHTEAHRRMKICHFSINASKSA